MTEPVMPLTMNEPHKPLFLAALLAFLAGGCFNYVEEITLKPDGSGTLVMIYAVPEILLAARGNIDAKAAEEPSGDKLEESDRFLLLPRDEIRKELEDAHFGVRRIRGMRRNATRILSIEGYFDDLATLPKAKAFAANSFSLKQTDDSLLFERRLSVAGNRFVPKASPDADDGLSPYERLCAKYGKERLDSLLAGFFVQFTLIAPGEVVDSNATTVDETMAVWKYPLNSLVKRQTINMWCRIRTGSDDGSVSTQ